MASRGGSPDVGGGRAARARPGGVRASRSGSLAGSRRSGSLRSGSLAGSSAGSRRGSIASVASSVRSSIDSFAMSAMGIGAEDREIIAKEEQTSTCPKAQVESLASAAQFPN